MKKIKTAWPWLLLSLLIIVLDQLTKHLILSHVGATDVVSVFPFLNIILRLNAGAAFSFLGGESGWQIYLLSSISAVVAVVLVVWLSQLPRREWWIAAPVSLVLGGALGNLIDRVHYGYVIDFIDFHLQYWHFATFNIADAAVSVGATWLIVRVVYESLIGKS
ncbi:MAG: signal peptidase II [Gammaproteobacteria bacterium]|nr:signal peptidase II [Gammaproteobacteria bacterium]